jgi:hypothetical protein
MAFVREAPWKNIIRRSDSRAAHVAGYECLTRLSNQSADRPDAKGRHSPLEIFFAALVYWYEVTMRNQARTLTPVFRQTGQIRRS